MKVFLHGTSEINKTKILQEGFLQRKKVYSNSFDDFGYGLLTSKDTIVRDLTQCFLQGCAACLSQNSDLNPFVLAFDVDGTDMIKEDSACFPSFFNSFVIKTAELKVDKIVGIFYLNKKIQDFYKIVFLHRMKNYTNFNFPDLSQDDKDILDSMEEIKIKSKSVYRNLCYEFNKTGIEIKDVIPVYL